MFVCQDAGRLLYTLPGEWAHVNCSLWSAEVFEEDNGLLQNVTSALSRGRMLVNNCCYRDTCFNCTTNCRLYVTCTLMLF